MKLSAKMLYEAVKETQPVTLLGDSKIDRNLRFLYFYDGQLEHLQEGGVYLVSNANLPRRAPMQQDILWVTWGGEPPVAIPRCPVLFFHAELDPITIFNMLQQIFVKFCTWEEKLDQILSHGSAVPDLLQYSEALFQHPLCVVDAAHHYLGYTTSFLQEGERLFLSDEGPSAPLTRPLFYDKEHDVIAHIRNEDYDLGTLYMIHGSIPFSQTELLLFSILSDKLTIALQNLSLLKGVYENSLRRQLEQLFQTKHLDEDAFFESLKQWGGDQEDLFLAFKVKASHIGQKINAEYICSIFEHAFQASIAFWHDSILVVLVDLSKNTCKQEVICQKMSELLKQLHMKAGVSLCFQDLTKSWYHFRQACCAFEEGYPGAPDKTLYYFQDYVPSYILHHAVGEFPKHYLLDRGMQQLVTHDKLYAVSYLDTLDAFFQCRMNMSQTAELLKIHRTSLNSRMQKIWECLDHELTQEYLLYIQITLALLKNSGD